MKLFAEAEGMFALEDKELGRIVLRPTPLASKVTILQKPGALSRCLQKCFRFSPSSSPNGTKWKFLKTPSTRTCVSKSPAAWTSRSIWNIAGKNLSRHETKPRSPQRPQVDLYSERLAPLVFSGCFDPTRVIDRSTTWHLVSRSFSTLQVLVRVGQRRVEKVEETLLRPCPGVAIHFRHVQLQGEEDGALRDVPARWIHGRLHRGRQRYVSL